MLNTLPELDTELTLNSLAATWVILTNRPPRGVIVRQPTNVPLGRAQSSSRRARRTARDFAILSVTLGPGCPASIGSGAMSASADSGSIGGDGVGATYGFSSVSRGSKAIGLPNRATAAATSAAAFQTRYTCNDTAGLPVAARHWSNDLRSIAPGGCAPVPISGAPGSNREPPAG